ncbi:MULTISPECIES: thermonuclease family protein [Chitinibacter]|uniref:thermonuclease family protein n=1 Tax=Chitinibacter TaxID=230666 RepID=UPI0006484A7E|nr:MULTISPECIES: thermonuclease family protein [Chitinibacter]
MKITQQQQRAVLRLFTASNWKQRLSALLIVAFAVIGWACQRPAEPGQLQAGMRISGEVVGVADGDTVTVLDSERQQYKLRLAYIDAPEKAMPYGQKSKQHLSDLIYRKTVSVQIDDVDRYGRGVARIEYQGQDINQQQVAAGLAWHYTRYAKTQARSAYQAYQDAEQQARAQRSGLWQDSNPTPPWDWRKAKREAN